MIIDKNKWYGVHEIYDDLYYIKFDIYFYYYKYARNKEEKAAISTKIINNKTKEAKHIDNYYYNLDSFTPPGTHFKVRPLTKLERLIYGA